MIQKIKFYKKNISLIILEELQGERDRSKTLQNEMERCFSDLQLL
jgi:hypothetical protein